MLCFAVLLSLAVSAGEFRFSGGNRFSLTHSPTEKYSGQIFIIERNKGVLKLNAEQQNNILKLGNKDFTAVFTASQAGSLTKITAEFTNNSKRQLLLEPGLQMKVKPVKGDQFWGGFDFFDAENKALARAGYKGRYSKHISGGVCMPFPTASLINKKRALVLGGRALEVSSYDAAKYIPLENGNAWLSYCRRIVLEPGEKLTNTFFCGSLDIRIDYEQNIVEAFYDAYPDDFRPFVGKDCQYIRGIHSQYSTWARKPNYEAERRRFATIDWAYTPYKRSGDSYGRPEFWNYKPLVSDFKVAFGQLMCGQGFNYKKLTIEEFHRRRKEIFMKNARKYGYSFYACIGWCEKQLAETVYKDSLIEDTSVSLELGPWSTHHDKERRVFMIGNSYGKAFQRDMVQLAKELDLPGFAFDCGAPGVSHYGAAAKNPETKGRAWDEKGVFIDELCGVNQLVDFVHKIRPEDPLYVWKNGNGNCDMQMIETDLFGNVFPTWMPHVRYNAGQRPVVLHVREAYMYQTTIPDWRSISQKEFIKRWSKLGDHLTFSDFEYGMSNSLYGYGGNILSQYSMPELLECINLGWRALVPVITDGLGEDQMLYRARYGKKENSIIFFGNPYETAMPINFTVDNSGLGGKHQIYLPKMRDFAEMDNQLAGVDTKFKYSLPSRRPVLFEAVFGMDKLPAGGKLNAKAASKKDINLITYTAKLDNKAAFESAVSIREIDDFTAELFVNGKKVQPGSKTLIPPAAELKAVFKSKLFANPAIFFRTFPFVDFNNRPAFAVKLPDNPNEAEKKIAEHLDGYFQYTANRKITAPGALLQWKPGVAAIEVTVGRGKGDRIERKGRTIYLHSSSEKQAVQNYIALARVMDRRFEYWLPFVVHSNTTGQIAKRFNQPEMVLPWSRCFENAAGGR